ncbi:hypothetical protein [Mycobacterium sp.]|uniref:hypothetical protein n=1 Tax=Mycobacterium sp. TaxID=1785 RepID=UPI0031DAA12C
MKHTVEGRCGAWRFSLIFLWRVTARPRDSMFAAPDGVRPNRLARLAVRNGADLRLPAAQLDWLSNDFIHRLRNTSRENCAKALVGARVEQS